MAFRTARGVFPLVLGRQSLSFVPAVSDGILKADTDDRRFVVDGEPHYGIAPRTAAHGLQAALDHGVGETSRLGLGLVVAGIDQLPERPPPHRHRTPLPPIRTRV